MLSEATSHIRVLPADRRFFEWAFLDSNQGPLYERIENSLFSRLRGV